MRVCLFLVFIFLASNLFAQDSTLKYTGSVVFAGSDAGTPFWLYANQNGVIPMSGNFAVGQFGIYKIYNPNDPRIFQWSAAAEIVGNLSKSPKFFASDLYVAAKLGQVELLVGQRKNVTGLVDTLLTSGSLSVSGNSRPFPRIQIAIPEFYPLAFTGNIISVKASYSDGILPGTNINYGSSKYISQTYFHQKTLYLRFGNYRGKIIGFAGVNHQAIWGGEDKISPLYKMKPVDAYWHTVTGSTFNRQKIGNHFGTVDLGIQWNGNDWSYFLYRQNIYETGSLFRIINFTDGLSGLSIKRNSNKYKSPRHFGFQSFLFEVIGTKDQMNKNPFSGLSIFETGNYFNHYIYANGWSYLGRNMGTPLIGSKEYIKTDSYRSASEFTNNNRLWAFHGGITATWLNVNILLKGTYSRNFGTYISPFDHRQDQISILASAERKLPTKFGLIILASVASDIGHLYPNSTGFLVGIKKKGFLN